MNLSNLKPAQGSVKKEKRIARGEGSGHGGTSTRGHKGAKSRSGYSSKIGFEGGQMPLQRRVPKFGFNSRNRVEYKVVNLSSLQKFAQEKGITSFDVEVFVKLGLANTTDLVKVLGNGELSAKIEVKAHAFSKSAVQAIEAAQGSAITL
jgi:large subunit ribosomal protein L15